MGLYVFIVSGGSKMAKYESKYHRSVAEKDNVAIIGNRENNNKYWLVIDNHIIREDLLTNDEVAKEFYGYVCRMEFDID